jgi:hypothetical protein
MRQMYGEDLIDMVERLTRMRGGQRGCEFAEAFRGCGTIALFWNVLQIWTHRRGVEAIRAAAAFGSVQACRSSSSC